MESPKQPTIPDECSICIEKFNKSTRKLICCLNCNYTVCTSCTKTYILNSVNEAKCMNCNHFWNREFLIENISYSFVNKEYKNHRKNILFEKQKSKFEETNAIIVQRKEVKIS